MLRVGTWGKGRKRIFPPAWMWVVVAMAVTKMVNGITDSIHTSSRVCPDNKRTPPTMTCELPPGTQEYQLDDFVWEDITKVTIISNGNSLVIEEPLCSNKKKEVEIFNASKVTTLEKEGNCTQQLVLHYCRDVTIVDGVDLVRMVSSEADKVILPRVSQFDLQDSWVGEVSLTIDTDKSTLINSAIDVVTELVIKDSFQFEMENSKLGRVDHFAYKSPNKIVLQNVEVNSVSSNGFVVHDGAVTLKNFTIKRVESKGMIVMHRAQLEIEYSKMEITAQDSIVISQGAKLSLKNVTLGENREISFTLSDASIALYPLAFLKGLMVAPIAWIAIAVIFGLVVGGITGVGVMFYGMRRHRSMKSEVDTNELLTQEQPTLKTDLGPPTNNSFQSIPPPTKCLQQQAPNRPLPQAPSRPLPQAPNRPLPQAPDGVDETAELYEEYSDVLPCVPSQKDPQTGLAQRPPFALLKNGIKDQALAKPKPRPPPPKRSESIKFTNKDNRDVLPPPPPPVAQGEEELYDELQDNSSSIQPPPPTSANKPKLPFLGKLPPPPFAGKPKKP